MAAWPSPQRSWFLVAVAFLLFAAATIDRQIITFLVQPMKRDLGLTDENMGFLMGLAFAAPHGMFGIAGGYLGDRFSRKHVLGWGLAFWSVMTMACGIAKGFPGLLLARAAVGAGESVAAPCALPMVAESFPPRRRVMALSIAISGSPMGLAMSMFAGGAIVQATVDLPPVSMPVLGIFYPWQSAFLVAGALGLLVLVLLLFVQVPPRRGFTGEPRAPGKAFAYFRSRSRAYSAAIFGESVYSAVGFGVGAWMPAYLARTYQIGYGEIGLVLGTVILPTAFLGPPLAGVIEHWALTRGRLGRDMAAAAVLMLGAGIVFTLALTLPSYPLCVGLFGIGTLLSSIIYSIPRMTLQHITPPEYRGQATGILGLTHTAVGFGLGPVLIGTLATRVFGEEALGLAIIAVIVVLVPIAMLLAVQGVGAVTREGQAMADAERLALRQ